MRIKSTRSYAAYLQAAAIMTLLNLACLSPADAQTAGNIQNYVNSLPPMTAQSLRSDPHFRSWLYFYDQRAYPYGRIPPGAYQAARRDLVNKWGTPAASIVEAAPNGSTIANQWTSIGPTPISNGQTNPQSVPVSGRVNAIAFNPSNSNIIYIGAADGGVWETTDGGTTWTPLTDGQCSMSMGALAIDPVNSNIVYAGTGEENFSGDSYYGCGVLRSVDGGQTWTQLGASNFVTNSGGATISRFLIDPTTAGSASSTTVLLTADSGVYRSTNSGSTWTNVLSGVATDAVRNPSTPTTVYAALGNIFGNGSNGVYKSTDGGQNWTQLGGGFPTSNVGRINLAIAASSPSTLYAAVQNSSSFALLGVWKSTDGGASWSQLSATNASCGTQCWYDLYLAVDPTNASTVYFGGEDVFKSTDGGSTFTDLGGYNGGDIHPDQHALAFAPGNSSTIVIGNDGGVFKTTNGGSSWSSLNQALTLTQFEPGLSTTPNGVEVLGGTQDNGSDLYTGSKAWTQVALGDGGFSAIDFNTPTTAYHEYYDISPEITTNFGTSPTWNSISTGIAGSKNLFYTPFIMSPSNSHTLYLGTDYLNKTTNQGSSWSQIGTPGTAGFNPSDGSVSAIAEAKSNSQVVYVGTDGGDVQVTTNGGATWTDVASGLPRRYITHIAVNSTNASNAFVTVSGFGTGHVFETSNGGSSWTNISGNLPNIPTNVILLDPSAPTTTFYVGTDLGVFITTNGGGSWSPFQNGLPDVVVEDLVYNSNAGLLFASTHGRGVWTASTQSNYSITVSASPAGGGNACCSGSFPVNSVQTVTASANKGYVFTNWTENAAIVSTSAAYSFTLTGNTTLVANFAPIATHDFNGDGKSDILWRNADGDVGIWLMNGSQILQGVTIQNVPNFWSIVGQRDFTGNGNADILWQDSSGHVGMWLMKGTTLVQGGTIGTVPTSWSIVGTGDFNGDGKADILWRDTSGNVGIWLMNGTTALQTATVGNMPTAWAVVGSDMKGDIFWRNTSTGEFAMWVMNGTTVAQNVSFGLQPLNWTVAGIGDFDGNGSEDILWRDTAGDVAIWLMNGTQFMSSTTFANVPLNWSIVQTGDYNGDGKSDILWFDTTGNVGVWFMNGPTILQGYAFGNVGTNWSVQSLGAD